VCLAPEARGGGLGLVRQERQERGILGSVAHQITLGRHCIGILMPRVKRVGFVLERD